MVLPPGILSPLRLPVPPSRPDAARSAPCDYSGPRAWTCIHRRLRLRPAAGADRAASRRRSARRAGCCALARRDARATAVSPTCRSSSRPGDLLVFNDTRVIKARLFGDKDERRPDRGAGRARRSAPHEALAQMRASQAPRAGRAPASRRRRSRPTVLERDGEFYRLRFAGDAGVLELLERHGQRAAAALHHATRPTPRTSALPDRLRARARRGRGADRRAAFRRSRCLRALRATRRRARLADAARRRRHLPAGARARISPSTACTASATRFPQATVAGDRRRARARGGTVDRRRHDHAARARSPPRANRGDSSTAGERAKPICSSRPATAFRVVDRLITNFHLPKSTLLMLVVGVRRDRAHARAPIATPSQQRYRFFSYGDAMLIDKMPPMKFDVAHQRRRRAPRHARRWPTAWSRRRSSCRSGTYGTVKAMSPAELRRDRRARSCSATPSTCGCARGWR